MRALFDRQRRAREAAARWALRHESDASDEDGAFARWMASDRGHARLYAECDALWHDDTIDQALQRPAQVAARPARTSLVFAAVAFSGLLIAGIFMQSR